MSGQPETSHSRRSEWCHPARAGLSFRLVAVQRAVTNDVVFYLCLCTTVTYGAERTHHHSYLALLFNTVDDNLLASNIICILTWRLTAVVRRLKGTHLIVACKFGVVFIKVNRVQMKIAAKNGPNQTQFLAVHCPIVAVVITEVEFDDVMQLQSLKCCWSSENQLLYIALIGETIGTIYRIL